MGFFLRLKLETLSILDSKRIDTAILHDAIFERVYGNSLPPSEFPKVKAKKSYKWFNSAVEVENYMKAPRRSVWGERCFWQKISSPMGEPFAFVLYRPYDPAPPRSNGISERIDMAGEFPTLTPFPIECIVRTGESVWEVFRFTPVDNSV